MESEKLKDFENMDKLPYFEVEGELYRIDANIEGLTCNGVFVEWEMDKDLDFHLQGLYDLLLEKIYSKL